MDGGVASVGKTLGDVVADIPSFLNYGQTAGGITIPKKKYGVCDGEDGTKWSAKWSRFSTGAIVFSVDPVTKQLILNAESITSLFTNGPGQVGQSNLPYAATDSDTDSTQDGAVCDLETLFLVFGTAIQIGKPYVFVDAVVGPPAVPEHKLLANFLRSIESEVREALIDECNVQYNWRDNKCEAIGGPLSDWPQPGGAYGAAALRNGAGIGLSNIFPNRRPLIAGPQQTLAQIRLDIKNGPQLNIDTDPATPPGDEVTKVYVPVRGWLFGGQFDTCSTACAPNAVRMTAQELALWEQFLKYMAQRG